MLECHGLFSVLWHFMKSLKLCKWRECYLLCRFKPNFANEHSSSRQVLPIHKWRIYLKSAEMRSNTSISAQKPARLLENQHSCKRQCQTKLVRIFALLRVVAFFFLSTWQERNSSFRTAWHSSVSRVLPCPQKALHPPWSHIYLFSCLFVDGWASWRLELRFAQLFIHLGAQSQGIQTQWPASCVQWTCFIPINKKWIFHA